MLFILAGLNEVRAKSSESFKLLFKGGESNVEFLPVQDKLVLKLDFGDPSEYDPLGEFDLTINNFTLHFVGKEDEGAIVVEVSDSGHRSHMLAAEILEKLIVYKKKVELFARGHDRASATFPAHDPIWSTDAVVVALTKSGSSPIPESLVISYELPEPVVTTSEAVVTTVEPDQEEEESTVGISEQTPEETDEPEEEEDVMNSTFEPTSLMPETTTTEKPATESFTTSSAKTTTGKPTTQSTTPSSKATTEKPKVIGPSPTPAKLEEKLEPNKLAYLILLGSGLIGMTSSAILIALVSADKLLRQPAARDRSAP